MRCIYLHAGGGVGDNVSPSGTHSSWPQVHTGCAASAPLKTQTVSVCGRIFVSQISRPFEGFQEYLCWEEFVREVSPSLLATGVEAGLGADNVSEVRLIVRSTQGGWARMGLSIGIIPPPVIMPVEEVADAAGPLAWALRVLYVV
jgi:hypothetical protein